MKKDRLPEMDTKAPKTSPKAFQDVYGYKPMRPGSASQEQGQAYKQIDPNSCVAKAHYANSTETEAYNTWSSETICVSCACYPVCKIGEHIQVSLTTITRCLAYIPM
jgi:hypothetical protein